MKEAAYSRTIDRVFMDFVEMAAITLSNQVDFTHRDERENRYLEIIKSYEKRHQGLFPEMFAHLVEALEEKANTIGPEDILGPIFHELELHSKFKGQFFTPQHISDFMALAACGDDTQTAIEEKGYISMCEPCCGSGVMVTSMCKALQKNSLNYCSQLVVTAIDVDLKCVHMTYLQLALYGVPAVVIHGNSLTVQEWSRWYTPIYMLNGWVWRERCGLTTAFCKEDEMIKCASEPMYAAMRKVEALIFDSTPDVEPMADEVVTIIEEPAPVVNAQLQLDAGVVTVEALVKQPENKKRIKLVPTSGAEQLSLF